MLRYPEIMTPSQRAFLRDGSISQCLNITLNVLEDFKEKSKTNPNATLFLLAYDQEKAFDSVQEYTIRASLERFNLPDRFISFVLCNLRHATSCFKTFYGPTREFQVETSVRQGDPLSPLVYICITDVLHEGLRSNPLFSNSKTGYRFSNDSDLIVSSCGYADDLLSFAESWSDQWMRHQWVLDFCYVHAFKINANKSKYFISDWKKNDPRWLPSIDGKQKIIPQPPSTPFRYLGLWLSMSLDWSKQIQVLNKMVMDWRWKAHVARVDAAQLKTSIIEYLLPRMDIGLLHANITAKMCNSWLSTVLHTICDRAQMSNSHSLNRAAFCLLADIPDFWMRTQTSRSSDLLVNLNTRYCQNGRSTVARLCALVNKSPKDLEFVISLLQQKKSIKVTGASRLSSTLQYLKNLGINLACPVPCQSQAVSLVAEIKQTISEKAVTSLIAYTDGSTKARSKDPNSGCGIYITDQRNNQIWSGGMMVRSDGNNFIAEIAAAVTVIMAVPLGTPMTLRIDSMATIGALSQGLVSERKRVRAAARAWLNWCREDGKR